MRSYSLASHCVVKLAVLSNTREARNKLRNVFEGKSYHGGLMINLI